MSLKIGIIIGSTRPGRVGDRVAEWYASKVMDLDGVTFEVIDIGHFDLPLLDEPSMPSSGNYSKEHTKIWSKEISKYDAYVWVSPEYNHTPAPALTNAISFLYNEWNRKPVALVTYGGVGGARAAEQLRLIAAAVDAVAIRSQVTIRDPWAMYDQDGNINHELVSGEPEKQAEDLIWWAKALKSAK
jgi:NAD(P)H-dependent FMN reductase